MSELKNDLLLQALHGKTLRRPPVWMMRQAGRYLPDFMKLKEKYDFFTRCQTPELASEITVMPIDQIGTDAAILFSDILIVPQAMGVEVQMKPDFGPWLPNPVRSQADVDQVEIPDINDRLHYVMEAITLSLERLDNRVPLIGFAGAPWTIFCYMIQGQGSKTFDKAKAFCFSQPESAHKLLQKITDTTIAYLRAKHKAGVHVVQLFDSWGGVLSPDDYTTFSWQYSNQIINALGDDVPVILFAKGCWYALNEMAQSKAKALGVDWTCTARNARYLTGGQMTLQGNFDPARLLSPIVEIEKQTHNMIEQFDTTNYIANLGHGILPNIPVDHAKAFVDTVKSYQPRRY
ncbi:MAG: uroporphyrinogen decarboxylase [Bacteroidota bacterium]|nr:uroporphyrinogen decarboxylase [Bacteroidota bacterium]